MSITPKKSINKNYSSKVELGKCFVLNASTFQDALSKDTLLLYHDYSKELNKKGKTLIFLFQKYSGHIIIQEIEVEKEKKETNEHGVEGLSYYYDYSISHGSFFIIEEKMKIFDIWSNEKGKILNDTISYKLLNFDFLDEKKERFVLTLKLFKVS